MRFVTDHSLDRDRMVISKDGGIIAVAPSVQALVVISHAVVVGEEVRAHPGDDAPRQALDRRRHQAEGRAVRLQASEKVAPGDVVVQQPGDILVCRLADLQYVPGLNEDVDMIANPADVDAAMAMWFEDKRRMQ